MKKIKLKASFPPGNLSFPLWMSGEWQEVKFDTVYHRYEHAQDRHNETMIKRTQLMSKSSIVFIVIEFWPQEIFRSIDFVRKTPARIYLLALAVLTDTSAWNMYKHINSCHQGSQQKKICSSFQVSTSE